MQYEIEKSYIQPRYWRYGGPRDFWISKRSIVEHLVESGSVERIDPEHFVFDDPVPIIARRARVEEIEEFHWSLPYPGGLRIPHVHYRNEVFEMKPDQWAEFSGEVVREFADKLARAKTVGYGELMELAAGGIVIDG